MKLLFDQNLSPRLVKALADIFPESQHVHALELDEAHDRKLWEFAKEHNYCIVTKDADFSDFSLASRSTAQSSMDSAWQLQNQRY